MRTTPFIEKHEQAGARLVDFAGWRMPVQYTGLVDEHQTVRNAVGLFDVSHMGEIDVAGPDAERFLSHLLTNDVAACAVGQAQYNAMCLPSGGIVDDLVIYRRAPDRFLVCVNASNTDKDVEWVSSHAGGFQVDVRDVSAAWAQLALQGPLADATLAPLTSTDLSAFGTYRFREGQIAGVDAIIARTGYTGERGFELFFAPEHAARVWDALMESGAPHGIKPIGLGARDTLRLEMKYALYGNDIDDTTNPLEAGLGWIVRLQKGPFVGREALLAAKERGLSRRLVGFELTERGVPRHGYPVVDEAGAEIGVVTSGTHSPSLGKPIGMAYVPADRAAVGSPLFVSIRQKPVAAVVVKTPFYQHPGA